MSVLLSKKIGFIVLYLLICKVTTYAQSLPNTLSVDLAYSGLTDNVGLDLEHRERNYLLALGYHFSQRWAANSQVALIRTNLESSAEQLSTAYLWGITSEMDIVPHLKHRFFLRLGVANGDYCTCGGRLPQRRPGLFYLRYGIGLNLSVLKDFQLTAGFEANTILNKISNAYGYNILTVGIRHNRWLRLGK